jgi:hypothetical protein
LKGDAMTKTITPDQIDRLIAAMEMVNLKLNMISAVVPALHQEIESLRTRVTVLEATQPHQETVN